jgi:hypothetical protein
MAATRADAVALGIVTAEAMAQKNAIRLKTAPFGWGFHPMIGGSLSRLRTNSYIPCAERSG